MPMSEYAKDRLMPEVIGKAKREEIQKQQDKFRAGALERMQKAIRYAQMQKNGMAICDRYADQRYWDGYLAALNEAKNLI
nr:MAG TPA: hypothetical protein [Caudoviricetes sp.]